MMFLRYYGPYIKQMGKKYAHIAAVDASLIKLSLAAFLTVSLPGRVSDVILRLVVYQLTDGKIIRVLTSRHDLSALSIAMLYKKTVGRKMGKTT